MRLREILRRLREHFGRHGWWPAETDYEVILGAILVQRTAWRNVEKAIEGMRGRGLLDPKAVVESELYRLEEAVRSSGFYRQKAWRILAFTRYLFDEYSGCLKRLFSKPTEELRRELLELEGFGPETVDSILLYAVGRPVLPVDAYVRRTLERVEGTATGRMPYEELQSLIHKNLKGGVEAYRDLRALTVMLGKAYCRKDPICLPCPLKDICRYSLSMKAGLEAP